MPWQLRDQVIRKTIHELVDRLGGRCALAGTVGAQIHLAALVGLDKLGPPANAIELVSFAGVRLPDAVGGVQILAVDPLGFEASVEERAQWIVVEGERFPVAAPEHVLGMQLAAETLPADAMWSSFLLMRAFAGRLDLEEARGFLKRSTQADRQSLLAELAYLAA